MINQVLMGCGNSSVKLLPEARRAIRLTPFLRDHIVITPARVDSANMTPAQLLGTARHTFRIDNVSERLEFSGPSLMAWIGDGDGAAKGKWNHAVPGPLTFTQFVNSSGTFFGIPHSTFPSNGITIGTAYGSSALSMNDNINAQEAIRTAFVRFNKMCGDEFRVNPDGTLDWGQPVPLWKKNAASDLLISPTVDGNDEDINAVRTISGFSSKESGTAFATNVAATDGSTTTPLVTGYVSGLDGTEGFIHKKVSVTAAAGVTTTVDSADSFDLTCQVDCPDIGRYLTKGQPGDWVYLWDPAQGIYDLTAARTYRGEVIYPNASQRIIEVSAPITDRFGVYHLASNDDPTGVASSNTISDWSDFVAFESGPATLNFGAQKARTLGHILGI